MSKSKWDDWSDIGRMCTMLAWAGIACVLLVLAIILTLIMWIWSLT